MTYDLTDGINSLSKNKKVESGRKRVCREMEGILISLLPQEVVEIIKNNDNNNNSSTNNNITTFNSKNKQQD